MSGKKWFKSMVAVNAALLAILVTLSACLPLPAEQRATLDRLNTQGDNFAALAEIAQDKIEMIRVKMDNGETAVDIGKVAIKGLLAEKAKILEASGDIAEAIKKARETGLPWWAWALFIGKVVGSVIGGVTGTSKLGKVQTAFGVVSRAAEGFTDTNGHTLGAAINKEIAATPGASAVTMTALHAAARDKNI